MLTQRDTLFAVAANHLLKSATQWDSIRLQCTKSEVLRLILHFGHRVQMNSDFGDCIDAYRLMVEDRRIQLGVDSAMDRSVMRSPKPGAAGFIIGEDLQMIRQCVHNADNHGVFILTCLQSSEADALNAEVNSSHKQVAITGWLPIESDQGGHVLFAAAIEMDAYEV